MTEQLMLLDIEMNETLPELIQKECTTSIQDQNTEHPELQVASLTDGQPMPQDIEMNQTLPELAQDDKELSSRQDHLYSNSISSSLLFFGNSSKPFHVDLLNDAPDANSNLVFAGCGNDHPHNDIFLNPYDLTKIYLF